jgi:hypothetical protein
MRISPAGEERVGRELKECPRPYFTALGSLLELKANCQHRMQPQLSYLDEQLVILGKSKSIDQGYVVILVFKLIHSEVSRYHSWTRAGGPESKSTENVI